MTTVTAQSSGNLKSWEGTPEDEGLEATSENKRRGCGRDMLGQRIRGFYVIALYKSTFTYLHLLTYRLFQVRGRPDL